MKFHLTIFERVIVIDYFFIVLHLCFTSEIEDLCYLVKM